MDNYCALCKKRLQSHSCVLKCVFCNRLMHILCLPDVKNYPLYTDGSLNQWLCILCSGSELPFNHLQSDSDFLDVLSEQLLFNPFELNERKTPVPTDDIDPDIQYFNDALKGNVFQNYDYFLEDTFVQKYKSLSVYPTSLFSL